MTSVSYDPIGVENTVKKLNETIKNSNKATNLQNKIMIGLTIAIAILTFVMIMPIINNWISAAEHRLADSPLK